MTRQEVELFFNPPQSVEQIDEQTMEVTYQDTPDEEFSGDWKELTPPRTKKSKANQLKLF
jgi:hypothetical protein